MKIAKRETRDWHHNANHNRWKESYPPKSTIHMRKVEEPKSRLKVAAIFFFFFYKVATETSLCISYLLAKRKKPFTDTETDNY